MSENPNEATVGENTEASNSDPVVTEICDLKAQLEDYKDKYLRALAEFENYKKRAMKERSELIKYQGEKILLDMLEVGDNLERALSDATSKPESIVEGVRLIHKLFVDSLNRWEVKAVPEVVGQTFNPATHRALSRIPVNDAAPNVVLNEMRKAFIYKDRLLRPGEVVVSAAPAEVSGEGQGE